MSCYITPNRTVQPTTVRHSPASGTSPHKRNVLDNSEKRAAGTGQVIPITAARRRYSPIVDRLIPTVMAICRSLTPRACRSLRTSRTFRIGALSAGIGPPWLGRKGRLLRDSIADFESFKPVSTGWRLRSEWVADFLRNRWPDYVGISGRLQSEYAFGALEDCQSLLKACTLYARARFASLQLGCGGNVRLHSSTSIFWRPGVDLCWDLKRGLPFRSASISGVFTEHCIEHLSVFNSGFELRDACVQLLKECHRVMRPGAIIRIVVQDAQLYLDTYFRRGSKSTRTRTSSRRSTGSRGSAMSRKEAAAGAAIVPSSCLITKCASPPSCFPASTGTKAPHRGWNG